MRMIRIGNLLGNTWDLLLYEPCPACGGAKTKEAYLGGSVYVCPACQPR